MSSHPKYSKIAEDHWDTYKDLNKVFKKFKDFSRESTLLIVPDSTKVQLCRENAIISTPYTACDVMRKKASDHDFVKGPEWQKKHMNELADLVVSILEGVESSVPDYIKSKVDKRHWPIKLF
jgi:hypothetical protein